MKILYIMNVDWRWIKQRPHFIAEGLAKDNEVVLFYPSNVKKEKGNLCERSGTFLRPHKFYNLPFYRRNKVINFANNIYLAFYFGIIIFCIKPDLIWASTSRAGNFLPKKYFQKTVYDCMDDYYAMNKSKEILRQENRMVSNCQHIFFSSLYLSQVIKKRYQLTDNKYTVVRNGFDGRIINEVTKRTIPDDSYKIAYIGTVSSWFDFDLIEFLTKKNKKIEIKIIGPIDTTVKEKCKEIKSSQISFTGSVEHDSLWEEIFDVDCLIMPFVVNDIILSVDPVKLYEYINFGKNIVCVRYPEIERFSDFVNFYNTKEEADAVIKKLICNRQVTYSNSARDVFLRNNNWDNRMVVITDVLSSIMDRGD